MYFERDRELRRLTKNNSVRAVVWNDTVRIELEERSPARVQLQSAVLCRLHQPMMPFGKWSRRSGMRNREKGDKSMNRKYKKRNGKNLSGYQQRLVDLQKLQEARDFWWRKAAQLKRQAQRAKHYEAIIDALLKAKE